MMAAHRLTATLARRSLRCHTRAAAIHTTASVDGKRPSWLREVRRRSDDYAGWYRDVIAEADLVDQAPVKGCMVMKPHGMALWEAVREHLDREIRATGHSNACFPLLIPTSFLSREAQHVEGFAKECAVVTHHRLHTAPQQSNDGDAANTTANNTVQLEPDPAAKLADPLVVRPTSETVIWHMYKRWISSHRDLPLLLNQWANVVRWERRTRPFLRTSEFFWQEGHTAHATREEALEEAHRMLGVYSDLCRDVLALPVIRGRKSASERFAGADDTLTIEAMMQNGWALQSGTSHFLGQNFAKAFDVQYTDETGVRQHVWATSWGMSTRVLGAVIMSHSDDTGLVLPPAIAPVQIAITPLFTKSQDTDTRAALADAAATIHKQLTAAGFKSTVDDRDYVTIGAKRYHWERKGACIRLELGARELEAGTVTFKPRIALPQDTPPVPFDDIVSTTKHTLDTLQATLLEQAEARLASRTLRCDSYAEMEAALLQQTSSSSSKEDDDNDEGVETTGSAERPGFFLVPWHDDATAEAKVQELCRATLRCFPLEGQEAAEGQSCFFSGRPATHMAIFARAY